MMNDRLSPILHAPAYRIYRVQRLLRLDLVRFLDEHQPGLAPEHFFLLMRLADDGPLRQQQLVDPVIGDRPNISRHLRTLSTAGLVHRTPDPDDGRAWQIALTDAGRALMDRLRPRVAAERARLFDDLDPADLTALLRALDHLERRLGA